MLHLLYHCECKVTYNVLYMQEFLQKFLSFCVIFQKKGSFSVSFAIFAQNFNDTYYDTF